MKLSSVATVGRGYHPLSLAFARSGLAEMGLGIDAAKVKKGKVWKA